MHLPKPSISSSEHESQGFMSGVSAASAQPLRCLMYNVYASALTASTASGAATLAALRAHALDAVVPAAAGPAMSHFAPEKVDAQRHAKAGTESAAHSPLDEQLAAPQEYAAASASMPRASSKSKVLKHFLSSVESTALTKL